MLKIALIPSLSLLLKLVAAVSDASCRFESPLLVTTESSGTNSASCYPNCYTLDDAKNHLKKSGTPFVNAAKRSISCFDSREAKGAIAGPGGDAGEFIQGVAHWANATSFDEPADPFTWMTNKLKAYLNQEMTTTRPFYFCTAQKQLDNAFSRMQVNTWPKYVPTGVDLTNWLNELSKWDAQGSVHLRNMMQDHAAYGVPQWITVNAIKAVWALHWDKTYSSKIRVENFFATLQPQNIFHIFHHPNGTGYDKTDSCYNQQPLIKGTINPTRMTQSSSLYYHYDYLNHFRKTVITPFFFNQAGDNIDTQGTNLVQKAHQQYLLTVAYLASGVPITNVYLEKKV